MADPVKNVTGGSFVGFKVGSQATIDNWINSPQTYASAITEGTFYLTEDTHRLYIGNNDHTISAVNEGIEKYPSIATLPTKNASIVGRFCYATAENVLCIGISYMNGANVAYDWMQINANTDHYHTDFSRTVNGNTSDNSATLTDSFKDQNNASTTLSVNFVGDDGIIITDNTSGGSTPKIKISGEIYTLSVANGTGASEVDIKLNGTNHSDDDSKITLKPGANVSFNIPSSGTDKDKLIVTAENDIPTSISLPAAANNGNGFVPTIGIEGKSSVTGSFDPVIKPGSTNTGVHFVNGVATLPVYTQDEIDAKMQALNAMHYLGTVNSSHTGTGAYNVNLAATPNTATKMEDSVEVALPLKIGDTLLVNGSGIGGKNPGTLLIATSTTGAEGSNGYIDAANLKFEIVEETFFTDTNYKLSWLPAVGNVATPSIALKDAAPGGTLVSGGTTFAGGTAIGVSATQDASTDSQTITINHGNVAHTDTTDQNAVSQAVAASSNDDIDAVTQITVVTGVTVNDQGHITNVNKTTYNLHDTNAVLSSNQFASNVYQNSSNVNVGVLTNTVQESNTVSGSPYSASGKAVITSNTLNISAVAAADNFGGSAMTSGGAGLSGLNIEMTWGTF